MESETKKVILVVEDDQLSATVTADFLKANGYNVMPCFGGKMALEALQEFSPDLVLLDILMPEIDGYEVCKIIRSRKSSQLLPG
ncbi:MAG: response regulator [Candidatus Omnitrophica bacterium]|nr:response regulator [Candidatus Omnitrophota bacterium]